MCGYIVGVLGDGLYVCLFVGLYVCSCVCDSLSNLCAISTVVSG